VKVWMRWAAFVAGALVSGLALSQMSRGTAPVATALPGRTAAKYSMDSTGAADTARQDSPAASTAANFQTRCAAHGVVMCVGFDDAAEIARYSVIHGVAGSSITFDPTVPGAEGAGAAKFFVPAKTKCGADSCAQGMSGGMIIGFPRGFGQNSDFYFQFRQRWDSNYLAQNFNGEGWKQVLLYQSGSPCSALEIMLNDQSYRGYPQANTDCGAIGFSVGPPGDKGDALTDPRLASPMDFLYEQGATRKDVSYNCYRNATPKHSLPNCAVYKPNNWETFYCHVHVGTFGKANSATQCWVAYEGQALIQYINMEAMTYEQNSSPSDEFHTIEFTNYDSRATGSDNPATATWYDSFILSAEPIPAPNGPIPR
jgi:hypothetical protein